MRRFFKEYKILTLATGLALISFFGVYLYITPKEEFYDGLIPLPEDLEVSEVEKEEAIVKEDVVEKVEEMEITEIVEEPEEEKKEIVQKNILLINFPFTPQAPFAEWDDPIYADGCEEASSLIVVYWALDKILTKEIAKQEILAISNYETENIGEFRDASSQDIVDWIIKGYLKYDKVEIKKEIVLEDIIKEIKQGRAVIVPVNGRLLGNPYYTPPGPDRHMIVIRGYDREKGEFITNDVGTRKGEMYRYDQEVLYKAIRDYPTGYHEPILKEEKVMIVLGK